MPNNSQFRTQLWQEIDSAYWVFMGKIKPVNTFHAVRLNVARLAYKLLGHRYLYIWARRNKILRASIQYLDVDGLEEFATWLGDDYSRQMLIKLTARKLFQGLVQLEPPIDKHLEYTALERAKTLIKKPNTHTRRFDENTSALNFYDLSSIGYPVNAHLHQTAVKCIFMYEQYRYQHNNINVSVDDGDIAIDGGGWVGDTALYFAARGASKVYCFEFSGDNLTIFDENLAANPKLAEQITVVPKALWNKDSVELHFEVSGPVTSLVKPNSGMNSIETITLDTFVEEMKLERVDFIKMDIEGAEMNALEGAKNTIKRFAPKLAICVYHKPEDYFTIPQFIKSLRSDYTLYLDHFAIPISETVLFAIPRER